MIWYDSKKKKPKNGDWCLLWLPYGFEHIASYALRFEPFVKVVKFDENLGYLDSRGAQYDANTKKLHWTLWNGPELEE